MLGHVISFFFISPLCNNYVLYCVFVGDRAKREVDRRIVNRHLIPYKHTTRLLRSKEGTESSVRREFHVKWTQIIKEMIRFQPGEYERSEYECSE